jgi:GAF domain-containing protein
MNEPATLDSVLVSSALRRSLRTPDHQAESSVLVWLAEEMARAPAAIFDRLVEAVLKLTRAQSAGVSLLSQRQGKFVWPAVAGDWSAHAWSGTPRDFGPCGTVLDRDQALYFARPQRYFHYLADVSPSVEEGLLVPFHIDGKAMGTIWAVAHDADRQFDSEDERLLVGLSGFTSAAYRTLSGSGALAYLD